MEDHEKPFLRRYAIPLTITVAFFAYSTFVLFKSPLPWGNTEKIAQIFTETYGRAILVGAVTFFAWRPRKKP